MIAKHKNTQAFNSRILVISGPTACGKSDLAISLAKNLNAEIINCDSVQIYKDFNIGSNKPSIVEQQGIAHHLLDVIDVEKEVNAGSYCQLCTERINDIVNRGKIPLIVGGTNMWITSLIHGLVEVPNIPQSIRKAVRQTELEQLYQELIRAEPDTKLHPHDRPRIERRVELHRLGFSLQTEQQAHGFRQSLYSALIIIPWIEKELLYQNINLRTEKMLASGLVQEVNSLIPTSMLENLKQHLLDKSIFAARPGLRTIGYCQVVEYLAGLLDAFQMQQEISQATRRYAKRQLTFWRNEPKKRAWSTTEPKQYTLENLVSICQSWLDAEAGKEPEQKVLYRL